MDLQDAVTIAALAVGVLALPAAWAQVRSTRKTDGNATFRTRLASLRRDQLRLTRQVLEDSPAEWRIDLFPMLTRPDWIPESPFDLSDISILWQPKGDDEDELRSSRRSAAKVLANLGLGKNIQYSTALSEIAGITSLFDGRIYRLLDVLITAESKRMLFTESSYFAYLDTCELLAFESELAKARKNLNSHRRSYRKKLANPFNFHNRTVGLGVDTLTIRTDGEHVGFFLHRRDPKRVVNNADLIGAIPAGEFAPSDVSNEAVMNDLDIWRNIMREYAEEMLGIDDAQGQGARWIDYANDSPYRELNEARKSGRLRVRVLGMGIDPLPWKPELLTVCVIDSQAFDSIFAPVPKRNDEGLILSGNGRDGLPFDAATVAQYCDDENISPNTQALLQLAWKFRAELGLGDVSRPQRRSRKASGGRRAGRTDGRGRTASS